MRILTTKDFSREKFEALGHEVAKRQSWPRPFNPDHFFPTVHQYVDLGLMTVWEHDGAVLGGLFVKGLYAGSDDAINMFWWAPKGVNGGPLFDEFMDEAKRRDCLRVMTASFGENRSKAMERFYRRKGFTPSEIIYGKFLK